MKYALVTGSTKGIGKAIGIELLKKGYYVFFNYSTDDESAKLLSDELKSYKDCFSIIKVNLSYRMSINVLINEIHKYTNKLDCIVFNAGVSSKYKFKDICSLDYDYIMDVNVNIPFYLLQQFDDKLNNDSRIIFIGSMMGVYPHANCIPYSISKAAQIMLSKAMVKHYEGRDITVNTIAIGFADTDWHNTKELEHIESIKNKITLGRFCKTKEVASLCSQIIDNQYINGSVIHFDGGYCMK